MLAGVPVAAVCSSPRAGIGAFGFAGAVGHQADRGIPVAVFAGGGDGDERAAAAAQGGDQVTELVFGGIVDVVAVFGVGGAVASMRAP